jgi:hypothetical protein
MQKINKSFRFGALSLFELLFFSLKYEYFLQFLASQFAFPIHPLQTIRCANTLAKKVSDFPVPSRMSPTKLSLAGNNLITVFPARESLVSDIPAGDAKIANLFIQCAIRGKII